MPGQRGVEGYMAPLVKGIKDLIQSTLWINHTKTGRYRTISQMMFFLFTDIKELKIRTGKYIA